MHGATVKNNENKFNSFCYTCNFLRTRHKWEIILQWFFDRLVGRLV